MVQTNSTKSRGLKKAKWSFKILNCKIENLNKISEISKLISKDYKITFTNDILEIDITLKNTNYKSFIINSFKELIPINDIIIECDKTKVLVIDIYNIYDIIVNIIIDIEDEIKLLKNAVNNYAIFLELYSKNFESKINEIQKFLQYLNKDSLAFFKINDVNFLEIERQSNLLDKTYSFYKNYKKHLLIYIYNDNLLINSNYKLNEIITDENEMIYFLSSQCDSFNPYYNKNNLNIEEVLYNSEISNLKKQKDKLIKDPDSYFTPKNINPLVGLIKCPVEKSFAGNYYKNLNYTYDYENSELEKLQNILANELAEEIKQEKEGVKEGVKEEVKEAFKKVYRFTKNKKPEGEKSIVSKEEAINNMELTRKKRLAESIEMKEKKIIDDLEMVKKQHLEHEFKKEAILEEAELKKIQEMQEMQENDIEEDIIKNNIY